MPDLTQHDIEVELSDDQPSIMVLPPAMPDPDGEIIINRACPIGCSGNKGLERAGWINTVDKTFLPEGDYNSRIVENSTEGLYRAVYCYKDGRDG